MQGRHERVGAHELLLERSHKLFPSLVQPLLPPAGQCLVCSIVWYALLGSVAPASGCPCAQLALCVPHCTVETPDARADTAAPWRCFCWVEGMCIACTNFSVVCEREHGCGRGQSDDAISSALSRLSLVPLLPPLFLRALLFLLLQPMPEPTLTTPARRRRFRARVRLRIILCCRVSTACPCALLCLSLSRSGWR